MPLIARTVNLVEREQAEGTFRDDLPVAWLVSAYYSLIHGADDLARTHRMKRDAVLEMLTATIRDLCAGRENGKPQGHGKPQAVV